MSRKRRKTRKKPQFSKLMCVISWSLMAASVLGNFALAWFGRETLSDMVMALISFVTVFVNGGYITQNIFRDKSLNDNGLRITGDEGKHYIPTVNAENSGEMMGV
jgi:predicted permease